MRPRPGDGIVSATGPRHEETRTTTTTTTPGTAARPAPATGPDLLRKVLRIDGWSTAAFGVLMLAGGKPLSAPLGIPTAWSTPIGLAMPGGAAALALIAGCPRIPIGPTTAVIAGNTLSSAALLLLTLSHLLPLTPLGTAFLLIGAVVVAVYAALEYVGLRRYLRTAPGQN
ncbi:hypothetical protein [Streptomyces sp. NPDC018045]|uniref:hypothetical protein n=1 Tax=Streptomyces sp. NPDC018045 TaxID=3365037 RepID=UPI003798691B